jgi:signal peptidase I
MNAAPQPTVLCRWLRWGLRLSKTGLAIFGAAALIYFSCFEVTRIASGSMAPTLRGEDWKTGDLVLSEKVSFWFRTPRRWEVVSILSRAHGPVMKRVVGLPGEKIQMLRGGRIFIDGEEIFPPEELSFLRYFVFGNLCADAVVDCGAGYYVLGDDSRDSDDSRFNGPIASADVTGRPWLILAPREHRGLVR